MTAYRDRVEIIGNLKPGEVIRYPSEIKNVCDYFVVQSVEGGVVSGTIASSISGVNAFTIEELLEKEDLALATFRKL